jgi:hypothetical protein
MNDSNEFRRTKPSAILPDKSSKKSYHCAQFFIDRLSLLGHCVPSFMLKTTAMFVTFDLRSEMFGMRLRCETSCILHVSRTAVLMVIEMADYSLSNWATLMSNLDRIMALIW